jgi:hypothetical protein
MKKLIACLLSVLLAGALYAKEKEAGTNNSATVALTGIVYDFSSEELLAGVEVTIEGTDMKTYTDFDGQFTFKNIKPGEYKLITNYISYKKGIEVLKVDNAEKEVKIKLTNSN